MHGGHRSISRITGTSLVEVLVALLLLAVGLLGASSLHLASLRARHESALLSTAAQLMSGIAERMRAHGGLPDADNPYLGLDISLDEHASPDTGEGSSSTCFGTAVCNSAQLAQFDIAEWKQQMRAALPGARLLICRDLAAWDAAAHGLHWGCSGGSGAPIVIKLGWRSRQTVAQASETLPKLAVQLGGDGGGGGL